MFFLLRVAFWLGLVLLLLPLGLSGTTGQNVSVFDAFGAAQAVLADARGFCERQPQACAVGGQMATHLTEKAQAGAKWLYQALGSASGDGVPAKADTPRPAGTELTPQDLLAPWGGGENGRAVAPTAGQPPAPQPLTPPLPPRRPA